MNAPRPIELLLVEDDADDAFLFGEAIKDATLDATLIWMKDGDKMLSYLNTEGRRPPDIIFLDINMPRRCGKECLTTMRANRKFDEVPIVMFSTSLNEADIEETFSAGANLYLCKRMFFENDVSVLKHIFRPDWRAELKKRDRANYVVVSPMFLSN
jgi:DNA-binding response OmpR family regulator